jgi:hypothetical protein
MIAALSDFARKYYNQAPKELIQIYGPRYWSDLNISKATSDLRMKLLNILDNPSKVVNQILENVEARYPAMRRTVGFTGLFLAFYGRLPPSVQDILERVSGQMLRPVTSPPRHFL